MPPAACGPVPATAARANHSPGTPYGRTVVRNAESFNSVTLLYSVQSFANFSRILSVLPTFGYAMSDRYFVESPISGETAIVTGPEAHHLIHVMRAGPGLEVVLFDGSGLEFAGRVEKVSRTEVRVAITSRKACNRELPLDLTLGVSLPKGDRQKWLVEKATELGVRRLVPLRTARSVAQPVEHALVRLRRTVIEASKQCGRNRLLEIDEPRAWTELVAEPARGASRWVAHPGGSAASEVGLVTDMSLANAPRVIAAIGPEGGFCDEEIALAAAAGWQPIDLGPRMLRIETAAIWLCALAIHAFGSPPPSSSGEAVAAE